jgi:hypothetical protein
MAWDQQRLMKVKTIVYVGAGVLVAVGYLFSRLR